jgi:serine protease inhibitor
LNLLSDRTGAARQIDAWISRQTHGKLGDSASPASLPPKTNLVLTCAIYFKADWSYPFFEQVTKSARFHIDRKQSVEVPMMHYDDIVQAFRLAITEEAQILELKYGLPSERTGEFTMLVLLPTSDDGLPALERQLTTDNLDRWIATLAPGHIDVFLPKFNVASQIDLAPALKAMGATDAFSPSAADFTGMGDGGFSLSDAVHAAVVSIDEEGTEAAAATRFLYAAEDDSKPLLFRADHPFLFLIRHNPTGTILFVGRVENPLG